MINLEICSMFHEVTVSSSGWTVVRLQTNERTRSISVGYRFVFPERGGFREQHPPQRSQRFVGTETTQYCCQKGHPGDNAKGDCIHCRWRLTWPRKLHWSFSTSPRPAPDFPPLLVSESSLLHCDRGLTLERGLRWWRRALVWRQGLQESGVVWPSPWKPFFDAADIPGQSREVRQHFL